MVPSQAVQAGQNGEYVFILKPDQTVEARTVKAGIIYNGSQIIDTGVKPGETVVTDGQVRLKTGTKVTAKQTEGATNSVSEAAV